MSVTRGLRLLMAAVTVCLMSTVLIACGSPAATDVPGIYKVRYQFGEEVLTLRGDGNFRQVIMFADNPRPVEGSGTWAYDANSAELVLRNHLVVHNGYGAALPDVKAQHRRWTSILKVRRAFDGSVTIVSSADGAGYDYHK